MLALLALVTLVVKTIVEGRLETDVAASRESVVGEPV
jgi:hypothetical protein